MSMMALIVAGTITASDCQKNMAFAIEMKENGYICLSNSGQLYVKPGTKLDTAAATFLQTLSDTARKLNQNESLRSAPDHTGT